MLTEHQQKILDAARLDLHYDLMRSLVKMVDDLQGKLVASEHTIIQLTADKANLQTKLDAFTASTKAGDTLPEQYTEVSFEPPFDVSKIVIEELDHEGD